MADNWQSKIFFQFESVPEEKISLFRVASSEETGITYEVVFDPSINKFYLVQLDYRFEEKEEYSDKGEICKVTENMICWVCPKGNFLEITIKSPDGEKKLPLYLYDCDDEEANIQLDNSPFSDILGESVSNGVVSITGNDYWNYQFETNSTTDTNNFRQNETETILSSKNEENTDSYHNNATIISSDAQETTTETLADDKVFLSKEDMFKIGGLVALGVGLIIGLAFVIRKFNQTPKRLSDFNVSSIKKIHIRSSELDLSYYVYPSEPVILLNKEAFRIGNELRTIQYKEYPEKKQYFFVFDKPISFKRGKGNKDKQFIIGFSEKGNFRVCTCIEEKGVVLRSIEHESDIELKRKLIAEAVLGETTPNHYQSNMDLLCILTRICNSNDTIRSKLSAGEVDKIKEIVESDTVRDCDVLNLVVIFSEFICQCNLPDSSITRTLIENKRLELQSELNSDKFDILKEVVHSPEDNLGDSLGQEVVQDSDISRMSPISSASSQSSQMCQSANHRSAELAAEQSVDEGEVGSMLEVLVKQNPIPAPSTIPKPPSPYAPSIPIHVYDADLAMINQKDLSGLQSWLDGKKATYYNLPGLLSDSCLSPVSKKYRATALFVLVDNYLYLNPLFDKRRLKDQLLETSNHAKIKVLFDCPTSGTNFITHIPAKLTVLELRFHVESRGVITKNC